MKKQHISLRPGGTYHLFSQANGSEKLFGEEENYRFFLEKLHKYISPIADLYGYCLVPAQFQLLVKIKYSTVIEDYFNFKKPESTYTPLVAPDFIMERFSNWLNCYAKSFNKTYHRLGSLFVHCIRRHEITSGSQLKKCIFDIHNIPVIGRHCESMECWKWSSYHDFVSRDSISAGKIRILNLFGGKAAFIRFHSNSSMKELKLQTDSSQSTALIPNFDE